MPIEPPQPASVARYCLTGRKNARRDLHFALHGGPVEPARPPGHLFDTLYRGARPPCNVEPHPDRPAGRLRQRKPEQLGIL